MERKGAQPHQQKKGTSIDADELTVTLILMNFNFQSRSHQSDR